VLIAEVGVDMTAFPTAGHLCSWAGMSPGNNQSAGKRFSGRTTNPDYSHPPKLLVPQGLDSLDASQGHLARRLPPSPGLFASSFGRCGGAADRPG
jgi:Transposase IS116/IS110/IS902 family